MRDRCWSADLIDSGNGGCGNSQSPKHRMICHLIWFVIERGSFREQTAFGAPPDNERAWPGCDTLHLSWYCVQSGDDSASVMLQASKTSSLNDSLLSRCWPRAYWPGQQALSNHPWHTCHSSALTKGTTLPSHLIPVSLFAADTLRL